jgi:hypothetical protein
MCVRKVQGGLRVDERLVHHRTSILNNLLGNPRSARRAEVPEEAERERYYGDDNHGIYRQQNLR